MNRDHALAGLTCKCGAVVLHEFGGREAAVEDVPQELEIHPVLELQVLVG